jgi:ComF family protein
MLLTNQCYLCGEKTGNTSLICVACWRDMTVDKPVCQQCGRRVIYTGTCTECLLNPGFVDSTITLSPYQFPLNRLLLSLKYRRQLSLARELGERLAKKILNSKTILPDRIVPVPLHPRRLLYRGYNQSVEIARTISKEVAVPLDYRISKRTRNTLPQFGLKPVQRRKNIKNAFSIGCTTLSGSVAIVDDIVTTGQTANELAKTLKAAGASKVMLWACAHAG